MRAAAAVARAVGAAVFTLGAGILAFAAGGIPQWVGLITELKLRGVRQWAALFASIAAALGVAALSISAGHRLATWGRRARTAAEARSWTDDRDFVLYLRPFSADTVAARTAQVPVGLGLHLPTLSTEEEVLRGVLADIGPLVAIRDPRSEAAPLGATRLGAGDLPWQDVVARLLGKACLVVVRTGTTSNLLWEVRAVLTHCDPRRVVFLLPGDPNEYLAFRSHMQTVCPCRLPYLQGDWLEFGGLAGIWYFRDDWCPIQLLFSSPGDYLDAVRPMHAPLKFVLWPVYRHLGLRWSPPPLPFVARGCLAVPVVVTLLLTLGFALDEEIRAETPWIPAVAATVGFALYMTIEWARRRSTSFFLGDAWASLDGAPGATYPIPAPGAVELREPDPDSGLATMRITDAAQATPGFHGRIILDGTTVAQLSGETWGQGSLRVTVPPGPHELCLGYFQGRRRHSRHLLQVCAGDSIEVTYGPAPNRLRVVHHDGQGRSQHVRLL